MPTGGKEMVLGPSSLPEPDSTPECILRSHASIYAREKCHWLWQQSKAALRMVAA
jgi:hypothetical protein